MISDQVILAKGLFEDFVATIECIALDRLYCVLMEFMGAQTRLADSE